MSYRKCSLNPPLGKPVSRQVLARALGGGREGVKKEGLWILKNKNELQTCILGEVSSDMLLVLLTVVQKIKQVCQYSQHVPSPLAAFLQSRQRPKLSSLVSWVPAQVTQLQPAAQVIFLPLLASRSQQVSSFFQSTF